MSRPQLRPVHLWQVCTVQGAAAATRAHGLVERLKEPISQAADIFSGTGNRPGGGVPHRGRQEHHTEDGRASAPPPPQPQPQGEAAVPLPQRVRRAGPNGGGRHRHRPHRTLPGRLRGRRGEPGRHVRRTGSGGAPAPSAGAASYPHELRAPGTGFSNEAEASEGLHMIERSLFHLQVGGGILPTGTSLVVVQGLASMSPEQLLLPMPTDHNVMIIGGDIRG